MTTLPHSLTNPTNDRKKEEVTEDCFNVLIKGIEKLEETEGKKAILTKLGKAKKLWQTYYSQ